MIFNFLIHSLLKGDTMEPCWSRICRLLKRPWSWPLPGCGSSHGATNEAPTGGQRKESTMESTMESLYSPFFFSLGDNPRMSKKCGMHGRCSEISEGNETSHLKGVYRQQHLFVAVGHCHWSSSETTNNFVPLREYVPNLTATMLALQAASFV